MSISRLEQVPLDTLALDDLSIPVGKRHAVVTQEVWEQISDYTQSRPTSPSPGRIYRKNLDWREHTPDEWWLYVCAEAPEAPGFVDHHPYRVLVLP